MGDLAGYTVQVSCCTCHEVTPMQTWRGDRLSTFQLCEICHLREYRLDAAGILHKPDRTTKKLDPKEDGWAAHHGRAPRE